MVNGGGGGMTRSRGPKTSSIYMLYVLMQQNIAGSTNGQNIAALTNGQNIAALTNGQNIAASTNGQNIAESTNG